MGFLTVLRAIFILIIPFLIFLAAFKYASFDEEFYDEKFAQYEVDRHVPNASSLNQKIISFVTGKGNELPELNEREKRHLMDVRNAIRASTAAFYFLSVLFVSLSFASAFILRDKYKTADFAGKILAFGGLLTVAFSLALFLLINFNFQSAFEQFHVMLFGQGTYTFDASKELLVNIYPEQLFMNLGLRISKLVIISAVIIMSLGFLFLSISKNKKNK